jgi:hypothetical protein
LASVLYAAFVLWADQNTLHGFPNSGDEYSYLTMARTFAQGKLSVPSPEPLDFFRQIHFINDGRYFGKYPPGWPLCLALGSLTGLERFVNPLFGLLLLYVLYSLARRVYSQVVADTAVLLTVGNPYLVLNSASLFSHPCCAFFIVLTVDRLFAARAGATGWKTGIVLGVASGWAFWARPLTAVVIIVPLVVILLGDRWGRPVFRTLAIRTVPALALFGFLFLAYDWAQTGNPFLQPFALYDPNDSLAWPGPWLYQWVFRFDHNVRDSYVSLFYWSSYLLLPALLALRSAKGRTKDSPLVGWWWVPLASLTLTLFFYWADGHFRYGPRYYYEAFPFLVLGAGLFISRLGRWRMALLALFILLNVLHLLDASAFYRKQVGERMSFFEKMDSPDLSGSVVLVQTGVNSFQVRDLLRNGLDFKGPVLLAEDLGPDEFHRIRDRYPDRRFFSYRFDYQTRNYVILPYDPEEHESRFRDIRDQLFNKSRIDRYH